MEGNRMERKAKSSRDKTKPEELVRRKRSKNFLQSLMYREIGIGAGRQASTKDFEPLAEELLVEKEFEERKFKLPGVPRATYLMVYSPDGTKIASTHGNHSIYVTDIATGKNIKILSGHPRTPWCIAFHPMFNNILASGCLAGQVRIWDLNGGCEIWDGVCETVIASLAFHPTERLLVFATHKSLHFWEWSRPKSSATKTTVGPERIRYVAFDKSGTKLITGIENSPQAFRRTPNDNTSYLPVVRLNSIERFRNTHYSLREFATDRAHQNDDSARDIAAQRMSSNSNDNEAEDRRYSDYINRLLRFRNSRSGVVNIEVRRNTFGGPYEDEASGEGGPNLVDSTTFRNPRIDASDGRNESELRQSQSTSDIESSRVESPSLVSPGVPFSSLSTPSTSTSSGSSYSNQRGGNFGDQRPDILAAIWPRRRNEPPHPPPPVPVRAFVPPSPSSPIPSPLRPLSRATEANFGASTSSSTPVASTSSSGPPSKSPANDEDSEEPRADDSRLENISDYEKAYDELIASCEEAARLIGGDFKANTMNHGQQGAFRTDNDDGRETTSSNNRVKTARKFFEQIRGHDRSTTDGNESPLKKRIHDDSSDGILSYRVANAGESSARRAKARTRWGEETGEEVSRRTTPASTNLPSTSGFTVSSRSAFQPQRPRINARRLDSETSVGDNGRKETREIFSREENPSNRSNTPTSEELGKTFGLDECKNNNNNAVSNEQSGYWLLEESSDSDGNNANADETASASGNSGNSKSRWIALQPVKTSVDLAEANDETSARESHRDEEAPSGITVDRESSINRDRLSPVTIDSNELHPTTLFPLSALRMNRAKRRAEDKREETTAKATASSLSTRLSVNSSVIDHDDSRRSGSPFVAAPKTSPSSSSSSSIVSADNASKCDSSFRDIADSMAPRECIKILRSILGPYLRSGRISYRDNLHERRLPTFRRSAATTNATDSSETFVPPTGSSSAGDPRQDYTIPKNRSNIIRLEIKRLADALITWMRLANHIFSLYRIISLSWANEYCPRNVGVLLDAMELVSRETASLFEELKRANAEGTLPTNILQIGCIFFWQKITSDLINSWGESSPPIMRSNNASSSSADRSSDSPIMRALARGGETMNFLERIMKSFLDDIYKTDSSNGREIDVSPDDNDQPSTSGNNERDIANSMELPTKSIHRRDNDDNSSDSASSDDASRANVASSGKIERSDVGTEIEENNGKVEFRANDGGDGNVEGITKDEDYTRETNLRSVSPVSDRNATNLSRPNEEIASCSQPVTANRPENANSGDQIISKQRNDELDEYQKWLSETIESLDNLAEKNETARPLWDTTLRRPARSDNHLTAISRLDTRFQLFLIVQRFPIVLRATQRCYSDPFDRGGAQRNIFHKILMILKSASELTRKLMRRWETELPLVEQEVREFNDEEARNNAARNRERASSEGVPADDPFALTVGQFYLLYSANCLPPELSLRPGPRSFRSERSAPNFNDPTSRAHERRGFNVPVVRVNNVPINFDNPSTESENSRLRKFRELRSHQLFRGLRSLTNEQRLRQRSVSRDPAQSTTQRNRYSWLDPRIFLAHRRIHSLGSFLYGSGDNPETAGTGGVQQESGNESYDAELLDRLNISAFNSSDDSKSYRIQAWNFSGDEIPCIKDTRKNVVVWNCKIYNDASVDISSDGKLLAWMGCLGQLTIIGVQSLEWKTLGKMFYTTVLHFDTHVSLSLSPTSRYLLVGWASKKNRHRMFTIADDTESALSRPKLASIYELKPRTADRKAEDRSDLLKTTDEGSTASAMRPQRGDNEGRAEVEEREKGNDRDENNEDEDNVRVGGADGAFRNRQKSRRQNVDDDKRRCIMPVAREVVALKSQTDSDGINCIRWAPKSGQGIVYGTNTGQLNIFH